MIKYQLKKNSIKGSPAYGKYYAYPVIEETIDLEGLSRHMESHNTGFGRGMTLGILTTMVSCIKEQLLAGNKVKLGELGDFSIGLCSHGTKTREEFVPSKIHKVNVNWTPGSLFKGLIDEAQFHKVSTRLAQQAILDAETNGDKPVNLAELKAKNKKDEDGE